MLANVERRAKATPGPDEHSKDLSWKAIGGNFGAGTKGRKTFCDEAIAQGKKTPGLKYDINKAEKPLLGNIE